MVNRLTVTVGDITLSQTESSEQVFGVVVQTPHEDYQPSTHRNDVMILTLQVRLNLFIYTCIVTLIPFFSFFVLHIFHVNLLIGN